MILKKGCIFISCDDDPETLESMRVGVGRCLITLGSLNVASKFRGCLNHRVGEDMYLVHEGKGAEPSGKISKTINAEEGVHVRMADSVVTLRQGPDSHCHAHFQSLSRSTPNCESAASERRISCIH